MSIHQSSRKLFILAAALALLTGCARSSLQPDVVMYTLVTAEWLSQHVEDPDLVMLDRTVRVEPDEEGNIQVLSGRTDYEGGHIPSAGFTDLMVDLSDDDSPHSFAVGTPEQFCASMGALGVGDDSTVVL